MAKWLVVEDFEAARGVRLSSGDVIDDALFDVTELKRGGLAACPYDDLLMADAVKAYKQARDNSSRDTTEQGNLLKHLLGSPGGASIVNTSTGQSIEDRLLETVISYTGGAVVFRPGYVGIAKGIYGTWAATMAAYSSVEGPVRIEIDDVLVSPAVIPAGAHPIRSDAEMFGARPNTQLTIAVGATLANLSRLQNLNMSVSGGPVLTFSGAADRVILEDVAVTCVGGPLVETAPGALLNLEMIGSSLVNGGSSCVRLQSASTVIHKGSRDSRTNDNTIESVGAGNIYTPIDVDGGAAFSFIQIGALGALSAAHVSLDHLGWDWVSASGASVNAQVNEIIGYDVPAGGGTVNLPPLSDVPNGHMVTVKNANGAAEQITVLPNGADLIDGQALYLAVGGYSSAMFVGDPTNGQWRLVAKVDLSGTANFIYRPGSPVSAPNQFTDFNDLFEAHFALNSNPPFFTVGRHYISIDDTFVSPAPIPPCNLFPRYLFAGDVVFLPKFRSTNTTATFVEFQDGAAMDFFGLEFSGALQIDSVSTGPIFTPFGFGISALRFNDYARLECQGASPVQLTGGSLYLELGSDASWQSSPNPCVTLSAANITVNIGRRGKLGANQVVSLAGPSTAFYRYYDGSGFIADQGNLSSNNAVHAVGRWQAVRTTSGTTTTEPGFAYLLLTAGANTANISLGQRQFFGGGFLYKNISGGVITLTLNVFAPYLSIEGSPIVLNDGEYVEYLCDNNLNFWIVNRG